MFVDFVTSLLKMYKCKDNFGLLPLESFLSLFSPMLKGVSVFPTYGILQKVHPIR